MDLINAFAIPICRIGALSLKLGSGPSEELPAFDAFREGETLFGGTHDETINFCKSDSR
jgi:hypothetical protein